MASWNDVRRLALALPETSEGTSYGNAAWTVKKKLFAWERPLRRADLEALGERAPSGPVLGLHTADLEMKEALIAHDPRVFFTTPHFDGYSAVLVQLEKIKVKELKDALLEAWIASAPKRTVTAYLQGSPVK